ncbi:MAG: NYN domain-containing protein [Clostridium sp.]|nr:NYN domain-containing protein [Clostridium sp.]
MKFIFIDGYNVINSWSNLKKEKEISLDSARQKLIDILHNYGAIHQCKIMLVFDGYRVVGNLENKYEYNKNITVIFTKSGETADAYIEREIHNIGRRFEVSVVTSDSLEQQTIFQRGATRISSIEFYNMVFNTSEDIKRASTKSNQYDKSTLQDNVDEDILNKLEAMRRG